VELYPFSRANKFCSILGMSIVSFVFHIFYSLMIIINFKSIEVDNMENNYVKFNDVHTRSPDNSSSHKGF
jgi:hypothetical protein